MGGIAFLGAVLFIVLLAILCYAIAEVFASL